MIQVVGNPSSQELAKVDRTQLRVPTTPFKISRLQVEGFQSNNVLLP
jgi:hypothetical protein